MKNKIIYLTIFLLGISTNAQSTIQELLEKHNKKNIPYISVEETRMLQLNDSIIILDSREFKEFKISKIPSAIYIGYSEFSSEKIQEKIKTKDLPIVVYCSLGIRSETIAFQLKKAGYTNVKNLYGGIFEWKNKGFPVLDSEEKETENVHVFSEKWGTWLKTGNKIYNKNTQ